ncbi:MAG: YbhB/YbcL family Raf kinase inhibitor-like protein [Candidatus Delongbacteria bacterium]|nr:YbhB/YbcL family Raf kinase inhibitor-like protein [Candidatus Delongbacteria bacterium]
MIKKTLIFIPFLLLLVIAFRMVTVYIEQNDEFNYHRNIPKSIRLWSADFEPNGTIPIRFTALGENVSPSLYWDNVPAETQSLAIIVVDYDAPSPFIKLTTIDHWIVFNIDPTIKCFDPALTSRQLIEDSMSLGITITGGTDYVGPNPPLGTHRYYFRVYALSVSHLDLLKPTKEILMNTMKDKVLAYGELIGVFKK